MNLLLNSYQKCLAKYPIGIQAIQTGLLMGSGDLISQTVIEKKSLRQIDFVRTGKFTFIGTVIVGPPLRIWYGILEKYFGNKGKMVALKKVSVDQLFFAPIFLAVIMGATGLTQQKPLEEIRNQIKRDYTDILKTNYKLWPAVQLCNFYIVPLQYQVITVQIVALFWNTYFSWKLNGSVGMTDR